jgi:hypothetical protein
VFPEDAEDMRSNQDATQQQAHHGREPGSPSERWNDEKKRHAQREFRQRWERRRG